MALIVVTVQAPGLGIATDMEDFEFAALNTGDEFFLRLMQTVAVLSKKRVVKGAGGSTSYHLEAIFPGPTA